MDHIKPAARAAGIQGKVGWHTLRHTYSTLLRSLGADVKVQQELLRHADIATTMNIYTQAVSEQKREAASKVARVLLNLKITGPLLAPLVPSCTQRFLLMTRNFMMALVAGAGFEPATFGL